MRFDLFTKEEDDRNVFITGNFNLWNARDKAYQLAIVEEGHYFIEIDDALLPEHIEYKFTKGGWENVEMDADGNATPNRKVHKSSENTTDHVDAWRYNWGPFKEEYFPVVELISDKFYIPQLDRFRKVWALLPHDYYESDKKYPVLYLQDAQNLFLEGSEYGNWEIDKKLSLLSEYGRGDIIVIAIDHGGESRIDEYVFDNTTISKGSEGKRYIRFITDTLKPHVDQHYRTKKGRKYTGIGGSSLGALISIYAGFLYPEVYSRWLIFSPSLWVEPHNQFPMLNFHKPYKTKVYIYGGAKEGSKMVERIQSFSKSLKLWEEKTLFNFEIRNSINSEGKHKEFFWSQEFPTAVEWLFYDNIENPIEVRPHLDVDMDFEDND